MGESKLDSNISKHDTPMCVKALARLKEMKIFKDVDFEQIGVDACWEIKQVFPFPFSLYDVPHDVYWSPNMASRLVGYSGKYLQSLCKKGEIDCYFWAGSYNIPVDEIIRLRKRYLAHTEKSAKKK